MSETENVYIMTACDFCGVQPDNEPALKFMENPQTMNIRSMICERCAHTCVKIFAEMREAQEHSARVRPTEAPAEVQSTTPEKTV